jgi:hypothetical protein
MKRLLFVGIFLCSAVSIAIGQSDNGPLTDQLVGDWLLQGTIAGKETVHGVHAQWVLNREYVELHEVSREKNSSGVPNYEAIIYIAWDSKAGEYACLWLDSTEGGALSPEGIKRIGRAKPDGNKIPFVFKISATENLRNTFIYDKNTGTWQWTIDDDKAGKVEQFAKVRLTKAR